MSEQRTEHPNDGPFFVYARTGSPYGDALIAQVDRERDAETIAERYTARTGIQSYVRGPPRGIPLPDLTPLVPRYALTRKQAS